MLCRGPLEPGSGFIVVRSTRISTFRRTLARTMTTGKTWSCFGQNICSLETQAGTTRSKTLFRSSKSTPCPHGLSWPKRSQFTPKFFRLPRPTNPPFLETPMHHASSRRCTSNNILFCWLGSPSESDIISPLVFSGKGQTISLENQRHLALVPERVMSMLVPRIVSRRIMRWGHPPPPRVEFMLDR